MSELAQSVYRIGRHGLPHGRAPRPRRASRGCVQPHRARAEQWVAEYRRHAAPTPAAAAEGRRVRAPCVGRDADVREVTTRRRRGLRRHAKGRACSSITPRRRPASRANWRRPRSSAASVSSMRRCRAASRARRTASSPSCAAATRPRMPRPSRSWRSTRGNAAGWGRPARASSPRWSTRSASPAWCRACPKA